MKELQRIKKMYELFIKKVSGNEKEELNYAEKQDFELLEKKINALEIINYKNVDIEWLKKSEFLTHYNECVGNSHRPLTQEEYDLLKEELL